MQTMLNKSLVHIESALNTVLCCVSVIINKNRNTIYYNFPCDNEILLYLISSLCSTLQFKWNFMHKCTHLQNDSG